MIDRYSRKVMRDIWSEEAKFQAWLDVLGGAKFYPTSEAKWNDVKQGVIAVEQQALTGGDVRELLDALQKEIAGE